jgi:catechol 2,3-dioxygenase-like lactoylglutathione lyase family enzyme
MRGILAALALALTGAAVPGAVAAKPSDGTVMRRTTLLVHDLERSARFYEILGFSRWFMGPVGKVTGKGLPVQGVPVGAPSRMIVMKGKDPYIGMIGLLQYGEPEKAAPFALKRGEVVLMIEITDMTGVERRLKAAGFRIFKEPETSHIKSVSDEWDAKFMFAIDPDGHMLELTERLN